MKNTFSKIDVPARRIARVLSIAMIVSLTVAAAAQQPSSKEADVQHEAMKKLTFLAGHWSGPLTSYRGPGEPLHLTQTENVQFKLGGLLLLIEGRGAGADGKTQFEALTTVSFDNASQTYHFRAYHDGNYLDTPLTVLADGFSWEYTAGSAKIVNAMRLTAKGEWQETTDVTMGNNPPRHSVEMLLTREQ